MNETLLVRAAVRPGKKLGLQSAAKNLQWRRWPYWLRQTVPNRCSSRREGSYVCSLRIIRRIRTVLNVSLTVTYVVDSGGTGDRSRTPGSSTWPGVSCTRHWRSSRVSARFCGRSPWPWTYSCASASTLRCLRLDSLRSTTPSAGQYPVVTQTDRFLYTEHLTALTDCTRD